MIADLSGGAMPGESMSVAPIYAAMIALMFAGLISCFFGYVLFRVELVFVWLFVGARLGAELIQWRFSAPSGIDYFVICTAMAVLGGLSAWFLHRLALALFVLIVSAPAVAALLAHYTRATLLDVWPWIVGFIIGAALAVPCFFFMRKIFIFLSAVLGAGLAVLCGAGMILDFPGRFHDGSLESPFGWLGWLVLAGLTVGIGIPGMYAQGFLSRVLRNSFMPPQDRNEKGKSSVPRADIIAKFNKV